jgi:hypothetical protein
MEETDWKPFRNVLDKKEKKKEEREFMYLFILSWWCSA